MIKICSASKKYKKNQVLKNINLEIISHGIVYINGESGSGKTTLINCLSGLDHFDEGEIYVGDKKVDNLKHYSSFVFQDFQLIDKWSVCKNLLLSYDGCTMEEVDSILDKLNILEIKDYFAYDISAGQKQRVAIARALLLNRPILIMDEPISNLDKKNAKEIFGILKQMSSDKLILIISHEAIEEDLIDQKIVIEDGEVTSCDVTKEDKDIVGQSSNKLNFKKIISLITLFFKKSKQSVLSIIALSLCFSILSLELALSFKNRGVQTYNFYKTSNVNYVSFYDYNDEELDIRYISLKEKVNNSNYFHTSESIDIPVDFNGESITIFSAWYKDILLKDREVSFSNDIVESLGLIEGDEIEIMEEKFIYVPLNNVPNKMYNTIFTSTNTYNLINKAIYTKCNWASTRLGGYVDFCSNSSIETPIDKGTQGTEFKDVVITSGLKNIIEGTSKIDISSKISIEFFINSYTNKNGWEYISEEFVVSGIIDSTDLIIYGTEETNDYLLNKYSVVSLNNGLIGYGIIDPKKSDFIKADSLGLIDKSVISNDFHIVDQYVTSYNGIIIAFSIVLFAISLILIVMSIGNAIVNNTKEMGILLSLDYPRKYFNIILFGGVLFISAISILLAVPFGNGMVHIMNMLMRKEQKIIGSTLYYVWYIPFVELAISIVISMIYLFIINRKIKKKTNIEIIYGK